jgi:RNA polymerase sigma factor (sigma-70 family)
MDEKSIRIQKFITIFTDRSKCYEVWLKFADHLLTKYFSGKRGRAYKAEDIVQEVIVKVIEGKRKWDFAELPDLSQFMLMNIKSFIHNLYKKERHHDYIEDITCYDDDGEMETITIQGCISPENIAINYELMEGVKLSYDKLEADEEYECLKVLELMRFEYKNSEIAEELEIRTSDVVNIKKRIRNKLKPYFESYNTAYNCSTIKKKRADKNKKNFEFENGEMLGSVVSRINDPDCKNYFMIFRTDNKK